MKTKLLLVSIVVFFLSSCGSRRRIVEVYSKKEKPKAIVVEDDKYFKKNSIPKINKINKKPAKITIKNTDDYISNFANIAMREMEMYKIPASITLAQGILESGSGRSKLAIRSNNHFGIKCHREWKGKIVTYDDDEKGECFRKYKHPETSYEDHSKFLSQRKRYSKIFKLNITDYKGWAYGLKKAGYATDPKYPHKLIGIIKKYNLTKYDYQVLSKANINKTTKIENKVKKHFHVVKKGDTLYSISKKYKIEIYRLKKINNLSNNSINIGQQILLD